MIVILLIGIAIAVSKAARSGIALASAPLAVRLRALNLAVWHRLFFEEANRPGRELGHGMLRENAA